MADSGRCDERTVIALDFFRGACGDERIVIAAALLSRS
jgi:hypothetical protein